MTVITRDQIVNDNQAPSQVATLGWISGGSAGTRQTLRYMASFVKQYRKNPEIRALGEQIINPVPAKDALGEVRAIFNFVHENIRYTQDIHNVETLKTPDATLYSKHGDCDDQAVLVATLLETVGYQARFVAIGMNAPGVFEHVYSQVLLGTRWVALDTTENVTVGWEPKNPIAYLAWYI